MKRSEINRYIREAKDFIREHQFMLPPFAFWPPEEWKSKGPEYDEIKRNQLGWDLTDFGSGKFDAIGLFLFTIRNGNVYDPFCKKTYAEKLLISNPGQVTPYHYHKSKMEDIINRGNKGVLNVQVYVSLDEGGLDENSPVRVAVDGHNFFADPGSVIRLTPGESITLFPGIFHQFWSDDEKLLLGEVSMVNDDHADNFFLGTWGRFPSI